MARRVFLPLLLLSLLATRAVAQQALSADAGLVRQMLPCPTHLHWLNQIGGWQVRWLTALDGQALDTREQRSALLERWSTAPQALVAAVDTLRQGLRTGRMAPAVVVRRVVEQVDAFVDGPPGASPLLAPAVRADDPAFTRRWRALVEDELIPSITVYRDFLRREYLPEAPDAPGLGGGTGGDGCFERAVERWTTLTVTPDEIESRGWRRLAELEEELLSLASPALGADQVEILDRLRRGDLGERFDSPGQVVAHARSALERARRGAPAWFGTPGTLRVEVVPMPRSLERSMPAGIYQPPGGPGQPARYLVNTSRPGERRLMSEVIAFHEGIPGHHLSFAVARAMGASGGGFNAGHAEGWAIYAERLADEMGLYSTRLDRIGMVTKHLWAASRLVVEPGLHMRGWSRERAVRFMLAHTALSRAEIELEVDRYMALPGQSLAYMLGYEELRRLRAEAERRLGGRFDIREFHDVILGPGIRPLPRVADDVARWIEAVGGEDGTGGSALAW